MNYFTPDLLGRFGSPDEDIANAASEEWDQVHAAYQNHLRAIRSALPRAARSLLRHFCLHDARVLTLATLQGDPPTFSIFLGLAAPRDEGVQLTYRLVNRPKLLRHPPLAEDGTPLEWLYDEFDLQQAKPARAFTHAILLTGGWELRLTFRDLKLARYQKVLAPAKHPLAGQDARELESLLA